MEYLTLPYLSSYSMLLPLLMSIIRFRFIGKSFLPFIYLIWIGGANELLSQVLIRTGHYNIINSNIYNLAEVLLLLLYFKLTTILNEVKMLYPFLGVLMVVLWIIDNFWIGKFGEHWNSYFNIVAGLPIVLMSISLINHIITRERDILKNPNFLLCTGFIIYFTYRILVEAFYLNGKTIGVEFMEKVDKIHVWINMLCNLIYAIAILWMQKRQAFTLRY